MQDGKIDESIPTNYDNIGHGAVRSAIFSLLLMKDIAEEFERVENRKDYIVLFEEPELFLHPKLMKQLRSLIYKVSETESPYQILCASHSPQMIDITKEKSSLVRMVKNEQGTKFHQINDEFLKESKAIIKTKEELKQEMNEVLRFNPFICESFYSDEVILVEGPTEEIVIRGYLTEVNPNKDIFIVNCGTVNNIPFYQKNIFQVLYNISSFLSKTSNELGTELESLKMIFEMKKELFYKSTTKGVLAEDEIAEFLNQYFAERKIKDRAFLTGNTAGNLPNNKTGDIICEVNGTPDFHF